MQAVGKGYAKEIRFFLIIKKYRKGDNDKDNDLKKGLESVSIKKGFK